MFFLIPLQTDRLRVVFGSKTCVYLWFHIDLSIWWWFKSPLNVLFPLYFPMKRNEVSPCFQKTQPKEGVSPSKWKNTRIKQAVRTAGTRYAHKGMQPKINCREIYDPKIANAPCWSATSCSPTDFLRSTIGARELNFWVRNGTRCAFPAIIADQQGVFDCQRVSFVPWGPHSVICIETF